MARITMRFQEIPPVWTFSLRTDNATINNIATSDQPQSEPDEVMLTAFTMSTGKAHGGNRLCHLPPVLTPSLSFQL